MSAIIESPGASPSKASPIVVENDPVAADLMTLSEHIRSAVGRHGWLHVAHRLSVTDFEFIASRLGPIELRTDIVVDPEWQVRQRETRVVGPERPGVYQAAALDLHTDRPTASLLAWYCVEPNAVGGATLLCDGRDLTNRFSVGELEELGKVQVGYTLRDPTTWEESFHLASLLSRRGDEWAIYFVPWLVQQPDDNPTRRLLERFIGYVRDKEENGLIPVRLERGQSLFIDNRRMLHGRGALPEDSRRHLVRVYIRTGDGSAVTEVAPAQGH